jgi:type IV secretion system protein TrbJ
MVESRREFIVRLLAAHVAAALPAIARAGGGVGVPAGVATEFTQLLNYGQLVAQYAKQAQMVVNQIQAQVTRVMSYATMLEHLYQLPGEITDAVIGPWKSQANLLQKVSESVNGVSSAATQVQGIYTRSYTEMGDLNMTGQQWLGTYQKLAGQAGSFFQQQYQQDVAAIGNLATKAQQLQVTAAETPEITGTVKGLQMLVQQSNVVAAVSLDTQSLLTRMVAQQSNEAGLKATVDSNSAAAQAAMMGVASEADVNEKALVDGGTFHVLTDGQ